MRSARAILTFCVGGLFFAGSLAAQTLMTGLVGYWNFDEGAGTSVGDLSGVGNNGTLINGGGAWVSGHFGTALQFSGTAGSGSTRVEISNSASLQITSAITFAAWVRVDNINGDAPILAKEGGGGLLSYWFGAFPTGYFGMLLDHDGNQGWDGDDRDQNGITQGTWMHIASTWDGSQISHYLNGTFVSGGIAFSGAVNVSTARLFIGANSEYNTTAFTGLIDDLYLYNRALSQSEVQQLMASPIPEPATWAVGVGLAALVVAKLRRSRREV